VDTSPHSRSGSQSNELASAKVGVDGKENDDAAGGNDSSRICTPYSEADSRWKRREHWGYPKRRASDAVSQANQGQRLLGRMGKRPRSRTVRAAFSRMSIF
jgi:hypothetical protein